MRKLGVGLLATLLTFIVAASAHMLPHHKKDRFWQHEQASRNYCGSAEQSASQVYANGAHKEGFCSHLPLVLLDMHGQELSQEAEVVVGMAVIDNAEGHNHYNGTPAFTVDTLIKIRGNSSVRFDKKQYRLTIVDGPRPSTMASPTDLPHRSIKIMGMKSDAEWVLNGPFLDKTMLRNYLMYNLAGEIMNYASNVRYCEVFIDGQYQGVYIMLEAVKVDRNRVDVNKAIAGRAATGYMVNRERANDTRYPLNNYGAYTGKTMNELGIAYPGRLLMPENAEFVRQDIGRFERALYSLDYDTIGKSYEKYIDVQSFIDYYLLNEFSLNVDGGGLSTYAHKALRGKLSMGPVWDFNNGFDNYEYYTMPANEFYMVDKAWYVMLFRDGDFVERIISRYRLLREGVLKEERLLSLIDETIEYLGPAVERNDTIWGYSYQDGWLDNLDTKLQPLFYDRNPEDYQDAVRFLKLKIMERGRFLDKHIDVLRQFSAESAVKEWN